MRLFNAGTNLNAFLESVSCALSSVVLGFAVWRVLAEIGTSADFLHKNLMEFLEPKGHFRNPAREILSLSESKDHPTAP